MLSLLSIFLLHTVFLKAADMLHGIKSPAKNAGLFIIWYLPLMGQTVYNSDGAGAYVKTDHGTYSHDRCYQAIFVQDGLSHFFSFA